MENQNNWDTSRIIRTILLIVLGLLLLIALLTGANILFFWSIFSWLQNTIQINAGLDGTLAKGIAAIIMAGVVMLPLGKLLISFSPIPQKQKGLYRAIIFICISIFFFFIYFGGEKTYFNNQTGEAMKYYSISPNGSYRFFSEPGYDPETGDALKIVSKETILRMQGSPLPEDRKKNDYFDSETGEPLKYYSISPSGNYRFFSNPGYDPETGDKLKVVTKEVIMESQGYNKKSENQVAPKEEEKKSEIAEIAVETADKYEKAIIAEKPADIYISPLGKTSFPKKEQVNEDKKGRLIFDNQSKATIWILNSYKERILTVPPNDLRTFELKTGKYYFTANKGVSYENFSISENNDNYQTFIARTISTRTTKTKNYYKPPAKKNVRAAFQRNY
jgi:hypothetical protein